MKLINIGFGNYIPYEKIVSIISPDTAPVKRMVQNARNNERTIDATFGRKTRSVIVMDSNHIVLSALQTETIANRVDESQRNNKENINGNYKEI